jgi:hypothetical protein
VQRRAQAVLNDESIDPQSRAIIRYAFEIHDPWLPELVRRADAGEAIVDVDGSVVDPLDFAETPTTNTDDSDEERIEALTDLICRAGDASATKSAALLLLMATIENSAHPKALANAVKHRTFTRCAEMNLYGIVDAQIETIERELFGDSSLA